MLKKFTAFLVALAIAMNLVIYIPNNDAYAEEDQEGEVVVLTGNPEDILTDPSFNLTENVDPTVLSEWYASEVDVPDSSLKKALVTASHSRTLTVAAMFSLPSTLNLSGLNISSLKGMEYALNVKKLNISNNKITTLEPLSNLYNLEYLDYSNNQVKMVPSFAFTSRRLLYVDGRNNSSAGISAPKGPYSVLQSLYLDNNQITAVPDISFCKALTTLSLNNNALDNFPASIAALSGLKDLGLSHNKISILTDISAMSSLNTLNLDNNNMTEFPLGLSGLTSLTYLALNNNELSSIPDEISGMKALETLILYQNRLTGLNAGLAELHSLNTLDVSLNNINTEGNEELINTLASNVESFYYKLQLPVFNLALYEDREAPGGKLVWSDIEDTSVEGEGSYTITGFLIERIEETISDDEGGEETESQGTTTGTVVPKVNVYTTVGEVGGNIREFVDQTAVPDVNYTFKVTAYISVVYQNGNTAEITDFRTVNTKDIQIVSNVTDLMKYIGVIMALCLLMVVVILVANKLKARKHIKQSDKKGKKNASDGTAPSDETGKSRQQRTNVQHKPQIRKESSRNKQPVSSSALEKGVKKRDVISAWDDVGRLDDEIDKLLSDDTSVGETIRNDAPAEAGPGKGNKPDTGGEVPDVSEQEGQKTDE